jgi:hypothetical protein
MAKKKTWTIDYDDETGFHILTDETGMERFRGKTSVLPTYLADAMSELDKAKAEITRLINKQEN